MFQGIKTLDLGDGDEVLYERPTVRFGTNSHTMFLSMFIIPSMILWVVVYPFTIIYFMRKLHHKKQLRSPGNKILFGYLFQGYNLAVYYWEFVKIIYLRLVITCCYELLTF